VRIRRVSRHAQQRWIQRSSLPSMDPLVAWRSPDAQLLRNHDLDGDEVRYHEPSDAVLVRKDDTLVTVIHAPSAKWRVRAAVRHVGGGEA